MAKSKSSSKRKAKGSARQSYYALDVCVSVEQRRSKAKALGAHKAKQKVCH